MPAPSPTSPRLHGIGYSDIDDHRATGSCMAPYFAWPESWHTSPQCCGFDILHRREGPVLATRLAALEQLTALCDLALNHQNLPWLVSGDGFGSYALHRAIEQHHRDLTHWVVTPPPASTLGLHAWQDLDLQEAWFNTGDHNWLTANICHVQTLGDSHSTHFESIQTWLQQPGLGKIDPWPPTANTPGLLTIICQPSPATTTAPANQHEAVARDLTKLTAWLAQASTHLVAVELLGFCPERLLDQAMVAALQAGLRQRCQL